MRKLNNKRKEADKKKNTQDRKRVKTITAYCVVKKDKPELKVYEMLPLKLVNEVVLNEEEKLVRVKVSLDESNPYKPKLKKKILIHVNDEINLKPGWKATEVELKAYELHKLYLTKLRDWLIEVKE